MSDFNKRFLAPVLILVGVYLSLGTVWSVATFEGVAGVSEAPTDASQAADIDDYIRDGRQELRYRTEVESCFGPNNGGCPAAGTGAGDNGRMREGSARAFMANGQPANLSRADYDNSTGASGSGTNALDDGRLWVDSNSTPYVNQLQVYDEVIDAQWESVSLATGVADDEVLAGSYNVVYNGSFEATDGTGDPTSTTVPDGWDLDATGATIAYTNPSGDVLYGDGYHVDVTDSGGGNDQIRHVLTVTGAKVWKIVARVVSDGASTCRLNTTGAAVNLANQDTTSAVWTTLSGTFTSAAPDTIDLNFITVTAGATCGWDHVAVWPIGDVTADRPEVSQPGTTIRFDSGGTCEAGGFTSGGVWDTADCISSLSATPPGPGYIVEAQAYGTFYMNGVGTTCAYRIRETVGGSTVAQGIIDVSSGETGSFSLTYANPTPVVGTTYTYELQATSGAAVRCESSAAAHEFGLLVKMYPAR